MALPIEQLYKARDFFELKRISLPTTLSYLSRIL